MNTENIFFTIKLPNGVGLSDKLWHLSKLYELGTSLSYTYIHTPFTCSRSYRLNYLEKIIKKVRKVLRVYFGVRINSADGLVKFLGLDKHELNINDHEFLAYKRIEVDLDKIFAENEFTNISDFKKYIEVLSSSSEGVIYSFVTRGIYKFVSQLDQWFSVKNIEASNQDTLGELKLPEKYWKARENNPVSLPFDDTKVKIVLHIRKGDTACINLDNKIISVFAESAKVVNSIEEIEESRRKPIDTSDFYTLLEKIFNRYGKDNFSVIVISDGYEQTFQKIQKAVRQGQLQFNQNEMKQIKLIEGKLNQEFDIFSENSNAHCIIGESRKNLFKSIHAIVSADILIMSSGGFAYWLHTLLKKPNHPSIIIGAGAYDDQIIEEIGTKIAKLAQIGN